MPELEPDLKPPIANGDKKHKTGELSSLEIIFEGVIEQILGYKEIFEEKDGKRSFQGIETKFVFSDKKDSKSRSLTYLVMLPESIVNSPAVKIYRCTDGTGYRIHDSSKNRWYVQEIRKI